MEAGRSKLNIILWRNSIKFSGKWMFRLIKIMSWLPVQRKLKLSPLIFTLVILFSSTANSQKIDTLKKRDSIPAAKVDSLIRVDRRPRKAAIRSAILPGWGQAYNKKYWKMPIIYAALGITAYIFIDNVQTYKDLKFAYAAKYKTMQTPPDSSDYFKIKPQYQPIDIEALRQDRNQFRQYVDYSAVVFVVLWGLNIVDAVVDAHLKAFDISPDLSMKIKPSYNPIINSGGISFVFHFRH